MGPYVIVGAYEGRAERIHQGEVSVSTIAGSKKSKNQRLELAVPQIAIQEPNECLFFARSDIIEIINRFRLLELGIVSFSWFPTVESSKIIIFTEWPLLQKCLS